MDTEDREKRIEGLKECCSTMLRLMGEDVERAKVSSRPPSVWHAPYLIPRRATTRTPRQYFVEPCSRRTTARW